jgi:hypothetical protein
VSRALAFLVVTLAVAAAGVSSAATLRFVPVTSGTTTPNGKQVPSGFLALTRAGEARFSARLGAASRAAVGRVDLHRRAVVAVFLDGAPCSSKLTVTRVARSGRVLSVHLAFTRPPAGVAMCVRTSTPYLAIALPRTSLGATPPTRVEVDAAPRA